MNCNLTQRFINAFPNHLPNREVLDLVNDRLKLVKPEKEDDFFRTYFDRYEYFPTPKRINTILKEMPDLKKETAWNYSQSNKTTEWDGIRLFSNAYENGEVCIICGSPKQNSNCTIAEKGKDGDYVQPCACSGGNPKLSYLHEWQAFCKSEGYINYQMYYWYHTRKIDRDIQNEKLRLKTMTGEEFIADIEGK